MYYRIIPRSDELLHYGVIGMHWGVRRYQDYDGSRLKDGKTVVKGSSTAKKLSNTIVGGQGGKTTGLSRAAANLKGATKVDKNKDNKNGWLDRTTDHGKGKAKTSPAEDLAKGIRDTSRDSKELVRIAEKHDPRAKEFGQQQSDKAKQMSDKELRETINRIRMEREYVNLTMEDSDVHSGYERAREVLDVVGDVASIALTVLGVAIAIKKLKHSNEDTEDLENELDVLVHSGNFDDEFIQHALDLDEEYIEDYLEHYGVKGMHWGVRRYQNYDGTRIGTGSGRSNASNRFRNTTVGGQGGKATGTARLAAKSVDSKSVIASLIDSNKKEIKELTKLADKAKQEAKKVDVDALNKYEDDYLNRSIDWSIDSIKKNNPDYWKMIEEDAKREGFDVRDHKVVRWNTDAYSEVEPFNPPSSADYDKAFDDYYDSVQTYAQSAAKTYGVEKQELVDAILRNTGWKN